MDPIECMKAGIAAIKRQIGLSPNHILIPAWLPRRTLESFINRLAFVERILGIGLDENGNQRTSGILWSKRQGRRNKHRTQYLHDAETLPELIAKMSVAVDKYERGEASISHALGVGP